MLINSIMSGTHTASHVGELILNRRQLQALNRCDGCTQFTALLNRFNSRVLQVTYAFAVKVDQLANDDDTGVHLPCERR